MRPNRGPGEAPSTERDPLLDALISPLLELRERYGIARRVLAALTDGVEQLAASVGATAAPPPNTTPSPGPTAAAGTRAAQRDAPRVVATPVDVLADDLETVLDFQEALAQVEGVAGISIVATSEGRAHLVVDLHTPEEREAAGESTPTVVCAWCGKLIAAGGAAISHGLCPDCAATVFERRTPPGS